MCKSTNDERVVVWNNGTIVWINSRMELHRDGRKPALIDPDGFSEYFERGKPYARSRDGVFEWTESIVDPIRWTVVFHPNGVHELKINRYETVLGDDGKYIERLISS
jgi:hypothetical protein